MFIQQESASSPASIEAGVDAGKAYVNIHTTSFAGRGIRGFLAPVPELRTYALLAAALGVRMLVVRRRRRA